MTKTHGLKVAIRERMAKTGESYSAARRHLANAEQKVKIYIGTNVWSPGGPVTVNGLPLPFRFDLKPEITADDDTFFWGYGGSGPDRLAIALIADATGNDQDAEGLFVEFKIRVVATLPKEENWTLTDAQIQHTVNEIKEGI